MNRKVIIVICIFTLSSCASHEYWAFPPGKNVAHFRSDEVICTQETHSWSAYYKCLRRKGYAEITREKYLAIQEKELTPIDIVARITLTGEIYVGKSSISPGTTAASIKIKSLKSDVSCTGYAKNAVALPEGTGSLGNAELLCIDGRKIVAEFVYETYRAGYGHGTDGRGNKYEFIFGDFDTDVEKLKLMFDEYFKEDKKKQKDTQM